MDVPPERQFVGLDAFKKAMDTVDKGSVVLLATPPAFRPIHVDYAISKDLHVFMEKSFAVDAPGIRRVLKAGVEAQRKNLKIATGLRCRHDGPMEEVVKNIHDGMIGDVRTMWAYRMHGPVGDRARESSWNELAYQIANFAGFTWLNGSFLVDWLIHNIDNCCWVKNSWPISVQGAGGRQVRQDADQLFDHYAAEYTFADGTRMVAQGRLIEGCWAFFGDQIEGTTGSALLGEGVDYPRLFKGFNQTSENLIWSFKGQKKDAYQVRHDLLFDAIRNDKPYNETEWGAKSNLAAIMGRMACEVGQRITWDDAMNSTIELAPGLEAFTKDSVIRRLCPTPRGATLSRNPERQWCCDVSYRQYATDYRALVQAQLHTAGKFDFDFVFEFTFPRAKRLPAVRRLRCLTTSRRPSEKTTLGPLRGSDRKTRDWWI